MSSGLHTLDGNPEKYIDRRQVMSVYFILLNFYKIDKHMQSLLFCGYFKGSHELPRAPTLILFEIKLEDDFRR